MLTAVSIADTGTGVSYAAKEGRRYSKLLCTVLSRRSVQWYSSGCYGYRFDLRILPRG